MNKVTESVIENQQFEGTDAAFKPGSVAFVAPDRVVHGILAPVAKPQPLALAGGRFPLSAAFGTQAPDKPLGQYTLY